MSVLTDSSHPASSEYVEQKMSTNVGQWKTLNYLISFKLFKNAFFCGLSLSSDPLTKVVTPNYCPEKTDVATKPQMSYLWKEAISIKIEYFGLKYP